MQSKSSASSASAREFRKAVSADLPAILAIYARARKLMAANGNPTQWGSTFPRESVVRDDIKHGRTMLMVDHLGGTDEGTRRPRVSSSTNPDGYRTVPASDGDGSERILAVFALCPGEDPTYRTIDGAWLDDDEYVTLHRVASAGLVRGAAHAVFGWVMGRYSNVRVDTHPNNKAMQHVLKSNGFTRCGAIQLIDRPTDTLRIAFQRHDRKAA